MKMSRDQVKILVKECLLELLSEGLGTVSSLPVRRDPIASRVALASGVEPRNRVRRTSDFDHHLDTPLVGGRIPTVALKETIKRKAGGNPIMESIFADTALTTLPSQLAAGDTGDTFGGVAPQDPIQKEQFVGTPEQVFGEETTSRWANLAFMNVPDKKTA